MKKKRIVKLEPQTVELFAEVLSKLRPPPPLTVSQWADRYRVLSAESSAEPGRWHTEKAPYQRAIMDAIGDPHVRSVVVMSAAQIGKTDAFILNPLGYYMDYAPCPVMCMQPTLDMGQTLSKDRIAPMIRDTPRLTGLVDTKSRYAGNEVDVKVNVSAAAGNALTLKDDGLYVPTPEEVDISGKADKVTGATTGNLAALDGEGNLTDSGKKPADFVATEAGKRLMTDAEGEKLAGVSEGATKTAASSTNGNVNIDGKEVVVYTEPENVLHDEDVEDFSAEEIAALLAD